MKQYIPPKINRITRIKNKTRNKIWGCKFRFKRYMGEKHRELKDFLYKLSLPRKMCPLCGTHKLSTIYEDKEILDDNFFKGVAKYAEEQKNNIIKDGIIGFKCPNNKCKFVWRKETGEKDNKYLCEFD